MRKRDDGGGLNQEKQNGADEVCGKEATKVGELGRCVAIGGTTEEPNFIV